jgi:hydrogenase 3 maturation protease
MDNERSIFEQLEKLQGSSTVIVGIGNTLKGDDAAGMLVCEQLKKAEISACIIDAGTVPENYIQPIIKKAPRNLILIDAIDFNALPGAIEIFKTEQLSSIAISTHSLSPHLFMDVIFQSIKPQIYCIGIQPAHMHLGHPVSVEVSQAIELLCNILTEIFPPAS